MVPPKYLHCSWMKTTFNPVLAGSLVEAAKHLYLTFRIITVLARNYLFFFKLKTRQPL